MTGMSLPLASTCASTVASGMPVAEREASSRSIGWEATICCSSAGSSGRSGRTAMPPLRRAETTASASSPLSSTRVSLSVVSLPICMQRVRRRCGL